jgi:hypothetical protein
LVVGDWFGANVSLSFGGVGTFCVDRLNWAQSEELCPKTCARIGTRSSPARLYLPIGARRREGRGWTGAVHADAARVFSTEAHLSCRGP